MEPETLSRTPYALHALAPLEATAEGRDVPPPPGFAPARVRFDTGRAAYHGARYREAAAAFLEAARALPRGPAAHARTLTANRAAAYENAAHALLLAGDPGAARAALQPFVDDDPACADALRAILASLPAD